MNRIDVAIATYNREAGDLPVAPTKSRIPFAAFAGAG
jgi:hypothetical protein